MKRYFILLCLFPFLLSSVALSESIDFAQMDYDKLAELKKQIDYEYHSRPEAEPYIFELGAYEVGKDIKPGRYNVFSGTDETAEVYISICEDVEAYKGMSFIGRGNGCTKYEIRFGDDYSIELKEGNIVAVLRGIALFSVNETSFTDYWKYQAPNGTQVPVGIYEVGSDIPAGKYAVFSCEWGRGIACVYDSLADASQDTNQKNAKIKIDISGFSDAYSVSLEEGQAVAVVKPVILQKVQKLNFD